MRKTALCVGGVLCLNSMGFGLTWHALPETSPSLHTTAMKVNVTLKDPVPPKIVITFRTMDYFNDKDLPAWRAEVPTGGAATLATVLKPERFTYIGPAKAGDKPCRFWYAYRVDFTTDGTKDAGIASASVSWVNEDTTAYPWEKDPAGKVEGGRTWWEGLSKNNAGHFGWRYEPNGLLINNVSFNCIERSWYYFKPGRTPNESFQFNFRIPDSLEPKKELVARGDEDKRIGDDINRAGIAKQFEYKVDKGIYQNDKVEADWTSFRWRRNIKTKAGPAHYQELRYGILSVGVQVETNSPVYLLSFQDAKVEKGPAGIAYISRTGLKVATGNRLDPADMKDNWLLLLARDGSPEIPVLVAFQHRPDSLEWRQDALVIHRAVGVGTIAFGTPTGAITLDSRTLETWSASPAKVPVTDLQRFVSLITAMPWKCHEEFSVAGDWVQIRDTVEFLPWTDDWGTKPTGYSPVPPLISYAVERNYLPRECVSNVRNLNIVTKWGPYWARKGNVIDFGLPVPRVWDYYPLAVSETPRNKKLRDALIQSLLGEKQFQGTMDSRKADPPSPGLHPHYPAHDFVAGLWRASNYLASADKERIRPIADNRVRSALMPQNYRYRLDPITHARYLACTSWGPAEYEVNGEGLADIDYWQGLTIYGLYTHAKYSGHWAMMKDSWPVIRSLISYWESTNSWALFSPAAREAGELYHGDMPTAGYAGLVGFYGLTRRLGTEYQKDLAAYLLARASVAMETKFGFRAYAAQFPHQSVSNPLCSGFGERWVGAFQNPNAALKGFEPDDPWWVTGCIGPQSAQMETLDLYVTHCYKDVYQFESTFMKLCPDKDFQAHDDVRVMPHIMLRTFLDDSMRRDAFRFLNTLHTSAYLTRDAHGVAGLLSWDCPVRLEDWSPAFIQYANWDAGRGADIGIDAGTGEAKARLSIHNTFKPTCLLDGKPVAVRPVDLRKSWTLVEIGVPKGVHRLEVR